LCALRTEDLPPALARHRLDPDRALQHRGEGAGEIVGRDAGSPLQLDDSHPDPILPEKRGCRKLRSAPSSRAEGTSQSAFSMNQPGLRKVTGRPISSSDCSINVRWVSRFSYGASAPMVDKQTTLPGHQHSPALKHGSACDVVHG
jgi:hypothetical protein